MALLDTLVGGFFDWKAADKVSDAQQKSAQLDREAADRRASQLIDLEREKSGSFFDTSGGVETQAGAPAALRARSNLATGDIQRADKINALTAAGPTGTLTKDQADAIIQDELQDFRTATVDPLIDQLTKQNTRQFGGLNASNQQRAAFDDLQPLLAQLETLGGGRGRKSLDLVNQQEAARIANLRNEMNLYGLQAPAPGFAMNPATSNAAAYVAQTPIGANVPNVSGAAPYVAGSNVIAQYQQQQAQQENSRLLIELMRGLGNQPAGSLTGPKSAYTV
jgi:hypothetical protein